MHASLTLVVLICAVTRGKPDPHSLAVNVNFLCFGFDPNCVKGKNRRSKLQHSAYSICNFSDGLTCWPICHAFSLEQKMHEFIEDTL